MRILLVTAQAADREIATALMAPERTVEMARDGRAARANLTTDQYDVVLLDWALTAPSAPELLRGLRTTESDRHTYVIAMMANPTPIAIASAFQAGADDVLRRPVIREELMGRVGALERIKRWASKVLSPTGIAQDWSNGTDISKLRAWTDAGKTISTDIQGVLGREVVPSAAKLAIESGLCAEIPLTLATEAIDVWLLVAVSDDSLGAMSEIVFGQDMGTDALKDVVRELANTGGGAFKRAAEAEGVVLTTGLPTDVPAGQRGARTGTVLRDFGVEVVGTQAKIGCRLVVKSRALERLPPNRLAEGMVLAKDLFAENGTLLVPSGTRLTEATVTRLGRMLKPTSVIEIAKAA